VNCGLRGTAIYFAAKQRSYGRPMGKLFMNSGVGRYFLLNCHLIFRPAWLFFSGEQNSRRLERLADRMLDSGKSWKDFRG
jgi:hypothetical protein